LGFYEKLIVPRLINMAMRDTRLASFRQETIGAARGLVLEIGVGSGLNLPIYGPAVDRVCGIDPSPELLRLASQRLRDASVPVLLVRASAECSAAIWIRSKRQSGWESGVAALA
jgi:protein-L-isoaspartate O-methyltransferase